MHVHHYSTSNPSGWIITPGVSGVYNSFDIVSLCGDLRWWHLVTFSCQGYMLHITRQGELEGWNNILFHPSIKLPLSEHSNTSMPFSWNTHFTLDLTGHLWLSTFCFWVNKCKRRSFLIFGFQNKWWKLRRGVFSLQFLILSANNFRNLTALHITKNNHSRT